MQQSQNALGNHAVHPKLRWRESIQVNAVGLKIAKSTKTRARVGSRWSCAVQRPSRDAAANIDTGSP